MRTYSVVSFSAVDEEARIIEGVATTPTPDRSGDVVDPTGAQFSLPMPLLWQHQQDKPVGHVLAAKVTEAGIAFRAQIAKLTDPSPLRDAVETAWAAVKSGLVRGASVRIRPIEVKPITGTLGLRYKAWEWLELSLVTIPANAEASISSVKSYDVGAAAIGESPESTTSPGVPGIVKSTPTPRGRKMNYAETIKAHEASRAAKVAAMEGIQKDATDAGVTKTDAQREEFDTLVQEIEALDKELADFRKLEKFNAEKAAPVAMTPGFDSAAKSRAPSGRIVQLPKKLAPGIALARAIKVKTIAQQDYRSMEEVARNMYGDDWGEVVKATVAAGTTAAGTWVGNLVGEETSAFADFVEYLRPQTILGRFGQGGIPALRAVPFRVPLISQTGGGNGYWVGEGKAKGLTKLDFTRTTLEPLKVANIAVLTKEAIRYSSPSADTLVRDGLAAALRERLDIDFIDPAKAASANVSPASITNGVTPIPSSGTDADAVRADFKALFEQFIAANNPPTTGVIVMPSTTALALSLMVNALGQREFPDITMAGGTIAGLPVITSEYVPTDSDGAIVVLINAGDVYLGDEGGISIEMSREASLQMDSEPSHDSSTPTAAQLVSMFQTNSVAFLAERTINWALRRDTAVQYLEGVQWGSA